MDIAIGAVLAIACWIYCRVWYSRDMAGCHE